MEDNLSQDLNNSFNMYDETYVTQGTSTDDLDFDASVLTRDQSCQTMNFGQTMNNQCCQAMDFSLVEKSTATEKSTDFTIKTASSETMTQSDMPQSDEDLAQSNACLETFRAFIKKDDERQRYFREEIHEIGRKMQQVHRVKEDLENLLEKKGIKLDAPSMLGREVPHLLGAKLMENSSTVEARRKFSRNVLYLNREGGRFRVSSLRRGLIQNREKQGPSESDGSFNMTPLDEALPPSLHFPRRRFGRPKLPDAIRSNIERNRIIHLPCSGSRKIVRPLPVDDVIDEDKW